MLYIFNKIGSYLQIILSFPIRLLKLIKLLIILNLGGKPGSISWCSEKYDLEKYGIIKGSCLDKQYIEKLLGYSLEIKNNRNRSNCLCLASIDIGAYSSCDHGCIYCYACNHKIVKKNMLMHNENSPLLLGELNDDDQIIKRTVTSNKKRQLSQY